MRRGGGAGEPSWYLYKRISTIFPALPSALKGSAAPPRASRQEATSCIVDASSWSPSGKERAAGQHRHKKPRYVLESSRNDLSRLSGPFLSAPLLRLAIPVCVRIACHQCETRCCDDARQLTRLTMRLAPIDSPSLSLSLCRSLHWGSAQGLHGDARRGADVRMSASPSQGQG